MSKRLEDLELRDSIQLLLSTKVFTRYFDGRYIRQDDLSPQHFRCTDGRIVVYLDYKKPYYYEERKTKVTFMDWSTERREEVSFERFLQITSEEVRGKILFYLELF